MPRAISLGEAVIDLFAQPSGVSMQKASSFIPAPGGAPANVAIGLARLGVEVGFAGLVGDDPFGLLLTELFKAEGVDTTCCRRLADQPTMLALVASDSPNHQDFVLYRGAAAKLRAEHLDRSYIASAQVLLYSSVILSDESRQAALQAVTWANQDGVLVIYDANLRPALWPSLEAARHGLLAGLQGVSICKVNESELELLAGSRDPARGSRWILEQGPRLCLVTMGANGAYFNNGQIEAFVPGFEVDVVDTTGCGDAFLAAFTLGLLETELPVEMIDQSSFVHLLRFANAAGALTATRQGAMTALPTCKAVEAFLGRFSETV